MSVFSYHLVETSFFRTLNHLISKPKSKGLIHIEVMASMTLGSPLFSSSRILMNKIAVFAQWENDKALEQFLENSSLGQLLNKGWYLRLEFTRSWGKLDGYSIPKNEPEQEQKGIVVAITVARMKLFEVPRFIHWGRPVEKLVRDHPGTILSTASIRLPRTVSTFSIWKSQEEMTNMVHGHSSIPKPKRHSEAMKERTRKDFHFEFTTLRFKAISEHGTWNGKSNYIPEL